MQNNFKELQYVAYRAMILKQLLIFYLPTKTYHSCTWEEYDHLTAKDLDIKNDLKLLVIFGKR